MPPTPTPTPQDQARQIQARIRDDPDWFCRTILQLTLWSKQREIIESVRDNPRTAVRSSHGVGKTLTAGSTALWFLAAYPNESLVVTTAPTWRQVKDQLWKEIRHLQGRSGFFDGKMTETRLTFGEKWYAVGLSTNRAENFQGYHSPRLLFIVDEASGVRSHRCVEIHPSSGAIRGAWPLRRIWRRAGQVGHLHARAGTQPLDVIGSLGSWRR